VFLTSANQKSYKKVTLLLKGRVASQ